MKEPGKGRGYLSAHWRDGVAHRFGNHFRQQYFYVVYCALGQVIGYHVSPEGKLTKIAAVNAHAPQIGVEGLAIY